MNAFSGKKWPLATMLVCTLSFLVSANYIAGRQGAMFPQVTELVWVNAYDLWTKHHFYGVLTDTFLHDDWIMFTWDIFWLAVFGSVFEQFYGLKRWLPFYFGACLISTASSLASDGETGFGSSGVACAFFGFGLLRRSNMDSYAKVLNNTVVAFFALSLLSQWLARITNGTPISSAAHINGILYGLLYSSAMKVGRRSAWARTATVALISWGFVILFWCPWEISWIVSKAEKAYFEGKYDKAESLFLDDLAEGDDRINSLQYLAWIYAYKGDSNHLGGILDRIRLKDPIEAGRMSDRIEVWRQNWLLGVSKKSS